MAYSVIVPFGVVAKFDTSSLSLYSFAPVVFCEFPSVIPVELVVPEELVEPVVLAELVASSDFTT